MSSYEPSLFDLEDAGYGFGSGTILAPDGKQIAVHHSDDEMANALIRHAYRTYYVKEIAPNEFL